MGMVAENGRRVCGKITAGLALRLLTYTHVVAYGYIHIRY